MPSRLLLGLRVANCVMGITLDSELESESESEEGMYSMLSILMGITPRIWKGVGRRGGNEDAGGMSRTVQIDDIKASGTLVFNQCAVGEDIAVSVCHKLEWLLQYQVQPACHGLYTRSHARQC
jgi:hypothetical protein